MNTTILTPEEIKLLKTYTPEQLQEVFSFNFYDNGRIFAYDFAFLGKTTGNVHLGMTGCLLDWETFRPLETANKLTGINVEILTHTTSICDLAERIGLPTDLSIRHVFKDPLHAKQLKAMEIDPTNPPPLEEYVRKSVNYANSVGFQIVNPYDKS